MKKVVAPTIIILILASVICLVIAKGYNDKKRADNPLSAKIDEIKAGKTSSSEEEVSLEEESERLTAQDTCIVIEVSAVDNAITLRNVLGGDDKPLFYDGKTSFLTRHDGPMTVDELKVGDIVDVGFSTFNSKLLKVKQSESAWENKNVNKFEIDNNGKTITIADDMYKMSENVIIASGGYLGKLLDVTGQDIITVKGIDKDVYSIQIEKGHGYIRVMNDSYFVGGWIEIGQDIITVMTESMLIPVPEGTYDVKVTNKGYAGRETLEVVRDKETRLDLSKIEIEEVAIGHVQFDIKPDYAQLYVDGLMTDFEDRIPLEYGIHSVRVESAGYETVRANIRVGSEYATIAIELDEELSDSSDDKKSSSESSNPPVLPADTMPATSSDTGSSSEAESGTSTDSSDSTVYSDTVISDNKKIYVEGPKGAEVYLDGSYIGIAPCSTNKVAGNHTITLSKGGYETKSYTISVGNDGKDLTMSFSELSPVQ